MQFGRTGPVFGQAQAFVIPTLRPNIGVVSMGTGDRETGVALHLPIGAQIGWSKGGLARVFGPTPWVFPEVAYELRRTDHHRRDTFSAGLGFGYGVLLSAMVSYTPRIVVGSTSGTTSVGFRHSLGGHFIMSVICLELSHEVSRVHQITGHDVQFTVGLNFGPLLLPLLWG